MQMANSYYIDWIRIGETIGLAWMNLAGFDGIV